MEFVNENAHYSQDRINLKNKSPFEIAKSNKKALGDVGNLIHSKATQSNLKSTHLKVGSFIDQRIRSPKSPKQQNKVAQKSKKSTLLEKMDDEFFKCSCSSHDSDDFSYELPDCLKLSKKEIECFATEWSNLAPLEIDNDLDVSLELTPVSNVPLYDDDSDDSSFMDVLNESLYSVSQLPEITTAGWEFD
ncbi:uncharacterized protein LOC135849490 [Planococcus citri]|uniref:uncharacterized protein LOC135849490 n=1 Tax=Planococcus citri TaxID=170843 RepID=UPI0031F96617